MDIVMGHSRRTSGPGVAAARWLIVLWLMQYWSKELWVVDICISWSRRLHNTWVADCQIYSRVNYKWNCWKSRGTCPSAQQLATPLLPSHIGYSRRTITHPTTNRAQCRSTSWIELTNRQPVCAWHLSISTSESQQTQ